MASTPSRSFGACGSGDQYNAPGGQQNINNIENAYFGTRENIHAEQGCLQSLAFQKMYDRHKDIDDAAAGTCEWLLQHPTYTSWASHDRGLLWIKGKPGSGKSTLMRHVLEVVSEMTKMEDGPIFLSFFFHGRGSELQKTPLGLFRALLHQLGRVPGALSDLVTTFQDRCKTIGKPGEKWQWHLRELRKSFEPSLRKVLEIRPVWLFIDALDECGKDNAEELVEYFKALLQTPPANCLEHLHICFTCRHYPIRGPNDVDEINVDQENGKDMSTFVQQKLSSLCEKTSSTIPSLITERANGVFLWARLVVKQVRNLEQDGVGLRTIEAKILLVPPELNTLYQQLIENMGADSLKLIQWICFATRPLLPTELRWAMIVEADPAPLSLSENLDEGDYPPDDDIMTRRIQSLSCGLAEVTPDTRVVQFIHQSVKDYFVNEGIPALDKTTNRTSVVGTAHYRLSRICIRYLATEEIHQSAIDADEMRGKFPFLHYATTSWVTHAKQSDTNGISQEDLLAYFGWPSGSLVERWVHVYNILHPWPWFLECPAKGTSLVHVMSRYGIAGALQAILKTGNQIDVAIDAKDIGGRTALWWAAWRGHEAVARLLLKKGAHIDAADRYGETPLSQAAYEGHEAVVRLLLEKGARIDVAGKYGESPLFHAARRGREAVARLLLEKGARIDAEDLYGETPLSQATYKGHEAVVRLLLEKGARIDAKDNCGRTTLFHAARRGHEAVARLLLEKGARIDAADMYGETPLFHASSMGNEAFVRLLLEKGASIDLADESGRTPLFHASSMGNEDVVRLLLEKGARIDAADMYGETPLFHASSMGNEAFVRLLLEKGASIDLADESGRTPLFHASSMGNEDVVRLLLEKGASIDVADEHGRTPLFMAAWEGQEAIIRLLLEKGACIDVVGPDGRTPLSNATFNGHDAVARLLLEKGACTERQTRTGV